MFGNETTTANTQTATAEPGGMLTMDALLGKSVVEAKILEGGNRPKGTYAFALSEIDEGKYEIKKEEHPRVGQEAMMITFTLEIIGVDDKGKYIDDKGRRVTPEQMKDYVGKQFKENVMFGNDGLPKDDGSINSAGFDKFVTILSKIVGEAKYTEMMAAGATTQDLIQAAQGVKFLADISHNKWEDRVSDQLDLFSEFKLIN